MSQENVEKVRRAYDGFNRGDPEAMITDLAPTFEYVTTGALPDTPPVARGPEGYAEFARWLSDQFDDARVEIHELTDVRDKVVASVTLRGRGSRAARRSAGAYGTSGPSATGRSSVAGAS
jgi:ketosteroid isomerase-like protein